MNQIRKYAPLALALGLVFLIVFVLPEPVPQGNLSGVIEIGVISPTDESYPEYKYLAGLAEDELNTLCNESDLGLSFRFNVSSAENSPARSMEIVMDQWRRGVDLFVAGGYHSQLTVMRSFVDDNEILVISPGSTNVDMSRDDYIYRMSPNDAEYAPALASLLMDYGVDRVLLLGRESLVNREGPPFSNAFEDSGGEVIGTVLYPWESGFNASLGKAESILESNHAGSEAGVLLLDYVSPDMIHRLSMTYNRLSDVTTLYGG
ncbi:MAG: ABC transporter substrate-binding protein [archaeon]